MTNDRLTCIDKTLSPFILKSINNGMKFKKQQSYVKAKPKKIYTTKQANRKTIYDLLHFSIPLLERTSKVFKPLSIIQNKSLKQKNEIVSQL